MKRSALRRKTALSRTKTLRKKSLKGTVAELDGLCRQIVMIRDGFKCRRCGKDGAGRDGRRVILQSHHIRTKAANACLRFELDNLLLVCSGCHRFFFHSPDALPAAEWYRVNRGQAHLDRLTFLRSVRKGKKLDRGAIKLYLQSLLPQK